MHEAYEALPILERLPLQIESVTCCGNTSDDLSQHSKSNSTQYQPEATLLVGTKPGHLLIYKIQYDFNGGKHVNVKLERSNKSFSKKPIQQLYVTPKLQLIISLSDAIISIHDLSTFQLITAMQKTKGALCFAADLEVQRSSTGDSAYTLQLCVAVRKKLQVYFWKNKDFHPVMNDITIPDTPKCMSWCKQAVCLGFKREYFIVPIKKGSTPKELFPTGKLMEPIISQLDEDQLILVKDDISVFVDHEGTPTHKHAFPWSDSPLAIASQPPYLIALLPKCLEVRTLNPPSLIQNLDGVKAKIITSFKDWIFVASSTNVWGIRQLPISKQIVNLTSDKEYELALQLAKLSSNEDRDSQINHIQNLLAFELFCQYRFEESFKNFAKLGTDAAQVIGLLPNLLPGDYRRKIEFPSTPPDLVGSQLEKALLALIEYLTQKRNETILKSELGHVTPIVVGNVTVTSRTQLLQIIDTTLLKCYLKTNDALVAPLLRLPDNFCHVEECEKVLKKSGKHRELIVLYRKKGHHKKALDLLQQESTKKTSILEGNDSIIEYLQHLGKDHVNLILQFSKPVLISNPIDGMKIFTEDLPEIDSLPKIKVTDFLDDISPFLAIQYLEHVVYDLQDETSKIHNRLVLYYRDRVKQLLDERRNLLPEDEQLPIHQGPPEVIEVRSKLMTFLETSLHYEPDLLFDQFKDDCLLEERAIILGRRGLHEQALAIYAHQLREPQRAEEYSQRVYELDRVANKDVFLCLLKMYLQPSDNFSGSLYSSSYTNTNNVKPDVDAAKRILKMHSRKINSIKALSLLPENTHLVEIKEFLANVLSILSKRKRETQVLHSLMLAENYQVHEKRIFHENQKCVVKEIDTCRVCKKRIGDSAFARYPGNIIVHYFCSRDLKMSGVNKL